MRTRPLWHDHTRESRQHGLILTERKRRAMLQARRGTPLTSRNSARKSCLSEIERACRPFSLADLANRDTLLVFRDVSEISQASALDHVGACRHGATQGILYTVAIVEPNRKERGKR